MSVVVLNANKLRESVSAPRVAFTPDEVLAFRTLYDDGIVRGGGKLNPGTNPDAPSARGKQSTAVNLLRRFRLHADAILRFISDFAAPFTSNEVERAVRMSKVEQKISGCLRTFEDAKMA